VDIRRQNMLTAISCTSAAFHLRTLPGIRTEILFESCFAANVPAGHPKDRSSTEQLFGSLRKRPLRIRVLAKEDVRCHFAAASRCRHINFDVPHDDWKTIEYVYNAFVSAARDSVFLSQSIRVAAFSELFGVDARNGRNDGKRGENQTHMASEANFQTIKQIGVGESHHPDRGRLCRREEPFVRWRYVRQHGASGVDVLHVECRVSICFKQKTGGNTTRQSRTSR
jgi:hypothetical protein